VKTTIVKPAALPAATPFTPRPARFHGVLQAELARRCAENPRYSLRAFAKRLGVDHATLSQLLRGRRSMTAATIRRFGARLKLDEAAIGAWVAAERDARGGDAGGSKTLREVRQLTADAASLVSEWYHFAILELTHLDDFRADSRWIARVLGIPVDAVNVALQRLLRLGLLEMESRSKWRDRSGPSAVNLEGFAHAAVQRLALQARELAASARSGPLAASCDYSVTTLAVGSEHLPEAIERIARFRAGMVSLLEQGQRRDDVYQLEISFFPVTRIQEVRGANETHSKES
jgi:uncharacterized protein (TIGR02147 family)